MCVDGCTIADGVRKKVRSEGMAPTRLALANESAGVVS
jgi:hypothetical protein